MSNVKWFASLPHHKQLLLLAKAWMTTHLTFQGEYLVIMQRTESSMTPGRARFVRILLDTMSDEKKQKVLYTTVKRIQSAMKF